MKIVDESPWRDRLRRVRRAQRAAVRFARWLVDPELAAPVLASTCPPHRLGELRIGIARTGAHPRLEAGKRHNVALAATALDGIELAPDRPFSFWRAVGPATEARGYAAGMELRAGCAVPAIGGGLCLVSNALFALAVELGWTIVERHAHSQAVGDVLALDATIAFPHVDLRFRPSQRAVLDVRIRGDVLVVSAWGDAPALTTVELVRRADPDSAGIVHVVIDRAITRDGETRRDRIVDERRRPLAEDAKTCLDCDETACHARPTLLKAVR